MIFLKLALQSIQNRKITTLLTVISIALSVFLLLSVERVKRSAEDGFTQSVSQVDLLVGAKTGPLNLILYSVFNMGSASNNISWKSYQEIKNRDDVDWTIPYSLGDGHHGFRVVATDAQFYEHYRFRGDKKVELLEGQPALDIWDVTIGSDVQKKLHYKIGDSVVIAHGVTRGEGIQLHSDKPFHIVGILKPTGTPIDQSLYISLYGMEAIHIDWKDGAAPNEKTSIKPEQIVKENIKIDQITSFFVRTKSRIHTLKLQREINDYLAEPLLAIIPGVTLSDLWRGLSQVGLVLQLISLMVLVIGVASMVSTLLSSLNERRREMSILRSMGAGPRHIVLLLVFESGFLSLLGLLLGLFLHLIIFSLLSQWLENQFGFYITGDYVTATEFAYLAVVFAGGVLSGLIPALRASQLALKDGLTVKT